MRDGGLEERGGHNVQSAAERIGSALRLHYEQEKEISGFVRWKHRSSR
jgi:hypothetical protein